MYESPNKFFPAWVKSENDKKTTPCVWDSFSEEDKKKPMGISCPCKRCSPISF